MRDKNSDDKTQKLFDRSSKGNVRMLGFEGFGRCGECAEMLVDLLDFEVFLIKLQWIFKRNQEFCAMSDESYNLSFRNKEISSNFQQFPLTRIATPERV
jgi:hypothetical protein